MLFYYKSFQFTSYVDFWLNKKIIDIAGYELSNALSKEYQRSSPTIEVLESEVARMISTK